MSATLGGEFLKTKDRCEAGILLPEHPLALSPEEESSLPILKATRPVKNYDESSMPGVSGKVGKKNSEKFDFQRLAQSIVNEHLAGHLTLAVCNRVAHAQSLKKAIQNIQAQISSSNGDVLLLTSRFRLKDRKTALEEVVAFEETRKKGQPHPGLILVSTQVIEAGFDVSAARLWTEAAPWPSFVQRLGRLNRDGKLNGDAKAFVFEVPLEQRDGGPYDEEDLKTGKEIVSALKELCAEKPDLPARQAFAELKEKPNIAKRIHQALKPKPEPFPRASDVHGLFPTEPDVFGGFTDISPWVRNIEANADMTVFFVGKRPKIKRFRPGFRHEVASALAMWRQDYRNEPSPDFPALAIYMVAAHHGKVRTVLGANPHVTEPNVCGIPIDDSTALPWNPAWALDFEAANDGASGEFDADGTFIFKAPGWSGLVADLLGGWEKNAPKRTCGAVAENETHSLGPFALAYFETLLRAADGRSSANLPKR